MIVAPGTTSLSLIVQIVDDTGLGVTALTAATFPSVYIDRAGETAVAVTLSDLAAENSVWSSGGVKESASGGGYYRIDAPNALAATANQCAKLVGEASGKHLICPVVQVEYTPANAVQIGGTAAGSASIGSVTGAVGSVTGAVTVGTNNDKSGYALSSAGNAAIATAIFTDATASDFVVAGSPGAIIKTQLGGAFTTTSSSVFTTAALANAPTGSGSSSDQWATAEPGNYAPGTFGNLVATALTSTTSWIFAASSYTAPTLPAALGTPRQIANTPYTKTFTQNDLRSAIADQLVDASTNAPINLTGSTVSFRMISQTDKSVKINDQAATITDGPNGKVAYSWATTDLNTAGLYWGWWIVTTSGKTEHFPGDGEKMTVKVVAAE